MVADPLLTTVPPLFPKSLPLAVTRLPSVTDKWMVLFTNPLAVMTSVPSGIKRLNPRLFPVKALPL